MHSRPSIPGAIARLACALSVAGVFALGAIGAMWAASPSPGATPPSVQIVDFAFTPATITIRQHEVVTWRNDGPAAHTVTADDGSFDSGTLAAGDGFANLFDTAGTFTYHCAIHSRMAGTVVVEPVAATEVPSGPTPPPGTLPPGFNSVVTPPPAATATAAATPTPSPAPATSGGSSSVALIVGLVIGLGVIVGLASFFTRPRRRP